MKTTLTLAVAGLIIAGSVASFSGCNQSPEDVCTGWVEETCAVLSGCCIDGASFDSNGCYVQMTSFCQSSLGVEQVHAGGVVFDSSAAATCMGTIETCEDFVSPATPEGDVLDERFIACQRVVTGFRPAGSGCDSSTQCAIDGGDYPTCHNGVCARAIINEEGRCSFSFETLELFVCPVGTFCDLAEVEFDPEAPPSQIQFVFDAPCVSAHQSGEACVDSIPCDTGLYCDFAGDMPACRGLVKDGGDCSMGQQCAANLFCNGESCEPTQRPHCYEPGAVSCGDGICSGGEDFDTCPQDCGGGGFCGDGFCDFETEDEFSCPEDCGGGGFCGDGLCDIDEDAVTCPQDCGGVCGDTLCDIDEDPISCPQDCGGVCGDDVCDVDEDALSCPGDCIVCGDDLCDAGEEGSCIADCCGDGLCEAAEGEPAVCPADCCGDGVCDPPEDLVDCPADCP